MIVDEHGRAFVQRRAPGRLLFPGCWDIVGGHAEDGETALDTLRREIQEETGWRLRRPLRLVADLTWDAPGGRRRELDFEVEVEGDLASPRIEREKHTEYRWLGRDELDILLEQRALDDGLVHLVVSRVLAARDRG